MFNDGHRSRSAGTLLLVEDDPDIRESVSELLEEEGYCVWQATNGREALDVLEAGCRPDVILLDLMMPVMTGWEFLSRQQALDASIPVCVISGVADRLDTRVYPGSITAVTKPAHWPRILDLIRRYCQAQPIPVEELEKRGDRHLVNSH